MRITNVVIDKSVVGIRKDLYDTIDVMESFLDKSSKRTKLALIVAIIVSLFTALCTTAIYGVLGFVCVMAAWIIFLAVMCSVYLSGESVRYGGVTAFEFSYDEYTDCKQELLGIRDIQDDMEWFKKFISTSFGIDKFDNNLLYALTLNNIPCYIELSENSDGDWGIVATIEDIPYAIDIDNISFDPDLYTESDGEIIVVLEAGETSVVLRHKGEAAPINVEFIGGSNIEQKEQKVRY